MRGLVCLLALGCSSPATAPPADHVVEGETVSVPTGKGIGAVAPVEPLDSRLAAPEGSLTISAPPPAMLGGPTVGRIRVVPGPGYHINTRYPFVVTVSTAEGMTLAKQRLEGGRNGIAGDAETLSETELSIPITATPKTPGEHDVIGSINFGICKSDACLTRKMPVSFTVVSR